MALRSSVEKIKNWYLRFERPISSLSLIGGFVFDAVMLKRVDLFLENFWVVIHLCVVALGILLLNIFDREPKEESSKRALLQARAHFWLILIIQFTFGGLLSTFLVFYFRSATLATSWPFMLLLAVVFVCNEALKQHYARLTFQLSVLFISIFSFLIFFLPVVLHRIGDDVFILSGLLSLALIALFILVLRIVAREKFRKNSRWLLFGSIIVIFFLINILYFTNTIPPLPLSLKDVGVYHSISRDGAGNYKITVEPQNWLSAYFSSYIPFHYISGQPVYVYSAIFAPTLITTSIIHEWQYFDPKQGWQTISLVTLPISGGREGGYRTYSFKSVIAAGRWRVNIKTSTGLYLGRIGFEIINATNTPLLQEDTI